MEDPHSHGPEDSRRRHRAKTFTFRDGIDPETGKPVTGNALARALLRDARKAKDANRLHEFLGMDAPENPLETRPLTCGEAIETYVREKGSALKESTRTGYMAFRRCMDWKGSPLAGVLVTELTTDVVLAFRDWRERHVFQAVHQPDGSMKVEVREGGKASVSTVNRTLIVLEAAISWLIAKTSPEAPHDALKALKPAGEAQGTDKARGSGSHAR